jgi:hypothetical protein
VIAGLAMAVIGGWLLLSKGHAAPCLHQAAAICSQGFVLVTAIQLTALTRSAAELLIELSPASWPCASGQSKSDARRNGGPGGLARLAAAAHTGRRGPYCAPAVPRSGAGRSAAPAGAASGPTTRRARREPPGGLHLHFHGLGAAQVAAITARQQEGR